MGYISFSLNHELDLENNVTQNYLKYDTAEKLLEYSILGLFLLKYILISGKIIKTYRSMVKNYINYDNLYMQYFKLLYFHTQRIIIANLTKRFLIN